MAKRSNIAQTPKRSSDAVTRLRTAGKKELEASLARQRARERAARDD